MYLNLEITTPCVIPAEFTDCNSVFPLLSVVLLDAFGALKHS